MPGLGLVLAHLAAAPLRPMRFDSPRRSRMNREDAEDCTTNTDSLPAGRRLTTFRRVRLFDTPLSRNLEFRLQGTTKENEY